MSRKKARHLAPVPAGSAPAVIRSATERVELPTGGHTGIGGLLHELARHAFPNAFIGFSFELTRRGPVCSVTVRTSERFTSEQVDDGLLKISRALFGFGILKPAAPAPTSATEPTPAPAEDGAESPLPPPQSPPT